MAKVKDVMRKIDEVNIDPKYDMGAAQIKEIAKRSNGQPYNMLFCGFRFGYFQGMKAAKAEQKAKEG